MAAKKSTAGKVAGVAGVGLLVYLAYRYFIATPAARAATTAPGMLSNGTYGGSTGAGLQVPGLGAFLGGQSGQPGQTAAQQNSALAALMQKILQALGQKQQQSGGSSGGGSGAGGGGSLGAQSLAALKQQMAAIASYSNIANNMPIAELGGASLNTYVPGSSYLNGAQISSWNGQQLVNGQVPYQNFDVSQLAQLSAAINPLGLGGGDAITPASYDTGFIDPNSMQNFDVSQLAGTNAPNWWDYVGSSNPNGLTTTDSYYSDYFPTYDYSNFDVSQLATDIPSY